MERPKVRKRFQCANDVGFRDVIRRDNIIQRNEKATSKIQVALSIGGPLVGEDGERLHQPRKLRVARDVLQYLFSCDAPPFDKLELGFGEPIPIKLLRAPKSDMNDYAGEDERARQCTEGCRDRETVPLVRPLQALNDKAP